MSDKNLLINLFKYCLNVLRDNEGLVGDKALRTMSYLLILKLIEPHIGKEIDFDNYSFDFSHLVDEAVEYHKTRLLYLIRFSNLSNENEDNLNNIMRCLWDDILSKHTITQNIFMKNKGFNIQYQSTYKKLIDKINSIDFSKMDYDILGNAYEEVIQDIMTGKVLGQFFTQPVVKKLMVELIDPKIFDDGKIETCCDPTMGTGGFLITYLQYILKQAKLKNIKLDWNFIKSNGLYGKELDIDTYQLSMSNMLISSGHIFENMHRGDSIREPITIQFDNILANPPYGIKGLNYDDINNSIKLEYIPIKSNNAVSLFLQAIIYMLKINGKCAIVLPDGHDLFNKKDKSLIAIREYLMKTCDLKEIIYLPAGIFNYTSIKTCIFYFIKKVDSKNVLKTDIKYSNTTQKEIKRTYTLSKEHQTTNIKFYNYDINNNTKNLLVEVPIDKIANNIYSLNYTEYTIHTIENTVNNNILSIKKISELCNFLPKSKRNAKYGCNEGLYPFYKSSLKVDSYVNEPDYNEESLIIGDGGEPNINYGIKFSTSDHCYILQNKDKSIINLKYVYYYIFHNLEILKDLYTGIAIKNISKINIESIKIPIPSIECQNDIVKYFDLIYEKANKTSSDKIAELKQLNECCLNYQKQFGDNVVKKLGDITTYKSGKRLPPGHLLQNNKTPYPYIRITDIYNNSISLDNIKYISKETKDIINKYTITTDDIYITIAGTTGLVGIIPFELNGANLTENAIRINIINKNEILQKYLVYEIHYNQKKELKAKSIGSAIPKLSIERLMSLQIIIPSLERQKEIVEYCDLNNNLIKELEDEIRRNKLLCSKFLNNIVKSTNNVVVNDLNNADDNTNNVVVNDLNNVDDNNTSNETNDEDNNTSNETNVEDNNIIPKAIKKKPKVKLIIKNIAKLNLNE
jgi:type I restriction-modification system DNA methylase subunit